MTSTIPLILESATNLDEYHPTAKVVRDAWQDRTIARPKRRAVHSHPDLP
jgi:hypothetical protein